MTLVVLCGSCGGKVNGPHGTLYVACECDDPEVFGR